MVTKALRKSAVRGRKKQIRLHGEINTTTAKNIICDLYQLKSAPLFHIFTTSQHNIDGGTRSLTSPQRGLEPTEENSANQHPEEESQSYS